VEGVETIGPVYRDEREHRFEQVIGNSVALEAVLEQVERVAPTGSTVLILSDEVTAVNILGRRMASAVQLIQALGGGWDRSALPDRPECCGKLSSN
jgi:hypothetical protein